MLKIEATTCGGTGIGTGFLLKSGMVATVAHVVAGAVSVAITGDGETSAARVVGYDSSQDLALLSPSKPFPGYGFNWSVRELAVGDEVAALGYPLDQPETLTTGTISGLDRKVLVDGSERTGLIETDAPINPGNSGGPLVATTGGVVGLVDAADTGASGIGYAVDERFARPEFSAWQASPSRQPLGSCYSALGPAAGNAIIGSPASGSDAAAVTSALQTYFAAINSGDYSTAYAQLDAHAQSETPVQAFAYNDATSYDFNFALGAITTQGPSTDVAQLDFTSLQEGAKGPNGDTCDNWTLTYTMVDMGGTWFIDIAAGQDGVAYAPC